MKAVKSTPKDAPGVMPISAAGSAEAGRWPDLTADFELLGGVVDATSKARVAIASYEFVGVVRNGGIGTACTELALALAKDGHQVDLLFTGGDEDLDEEGFDRWRRHYRDLGVSLDRPDMEAAPCWDAVLGSAGHSLALYRMLKARDEERPYDVVHFVESLGHGFYSLLAKRQGLAFSRATTVVCTHSPRRWLAEAHGMPFEHPIEMGDEFLEERSIELADVVVSPSAHMLDWLRSHGVQLPRRSYVQQYVTDFPACGSVDSNGNGHHGGAGERVEPLATASVEELVFFGRLEPRKGIVAFCDALDLLVGDAPIHELKRITFLGKLSVPAEYLCRRAANWPWDWEIISNFDRDAALEYLSAPGRLAVMASTMDNSPNAVYEAIGLGIGFLASRGGGTAELVHPEDFERVTYDPRDPELRELDPGDPARTRPVHSGQVLARRLEEALAVGQRPARFAVPPSANRDTHLTWHRMAAACDRPPSPPPARLSESIDVRDVSSTRGRTDEFLLMVDPLIVASPELEASLAHAAANTDATFVTSLGSFDFESPEGVRSRVFLATGGPVVTGLVGNCAGAGVALARRDALEGIGVFDEPDKAPISVSDLLARAALAGEKIDVVPEVLYHLPASAIPDDSLASAQGPIELLRPYHVMLPPEGRDIAAAAARLFREEPDLRAAASHEAEASALLAAIVSSRSFRLTAPLRRAGALARHVLRRRTG